MSRGTFIAIRQRADGSLYLHKKTQFWSARLESLAIGLFIVIALVLLELAIFKSSASAQVLNRRVANSVMTSTGFGIANETPHANLVPAVDNDNGVLTQTNPPPSLWPLLGRTASRGRQSRRDEMSIEPGLPQGLFTPEGARYSRGRFIDSTLESGVKWRFRGHN